MFRLYVDESGDHSYAHLSTPERRYLCLVGCWFDLGDYQENFQPRLEALKQKYFRHDPDEPIILHRSAIINKKGPFRVLLDPEVEKQFNHDLLTLVREARFTLVAVVIDKQEHLEKYGESAWHPYHYCLTALLERYCGYLGMINKKGDVLAESRGKTADSQLKEAYKRIYGSGVFYHPASWFQQALTSHEIKLKPKFKNIAGLQLADIVAHPVKQQILLEKGCIQQVKAGFGGELCQVLEAKFNKQVYTGRIWGYGKKFLS